MIDLHSHTNASDGEQPPEELIDAALKKGIAVLAITDHDSVSSLSPAAAYAAGKDIEIIPGIEISCDDPLP